MTSTKKPAEKDALAKLADRGEQALAKLGELPGGGRVLKAFNELRDRVDELGKRAAGVDELERRVAELEREVAALKRAR